MLLINPRIVNITGTSSQVTPGFPHSQICLQVTSPKVREHGHTTPIAYELATDTYYGLGVVTSSPFQAGRPWPRPRRASRRTCWSATISSRTWLQARASCRRCQHIPNVSSSRSCSSFRVFCFCWLTSSLAIVLRCLIISASNVRSPMRLTDVLTTSAAG